ncbi:unnamed protein product [Prunus armeniaca]
MTDFPLRLILHSLDASQRLMKWQLRVDEKKESSKADRTSAEPSQPRDTWQLRVDRASNQKGAGAGVVIITPDGTLLEQAITLGFPA